MRTSPPVRMNRSGSGAWRRAPCSASSASPRRDLRPNPARDRTPAGLNDVPAAAVVERDPDSVMRVLCAVLVSALFPRLDAASAETIGAVADDADLARPCPPACRGICASSATQHQPHQARHLFGRAVSSSQTRTRTPSGTRRRGRHRREHGPHQCIDALLVPEEARHEALLGPTPVAVHHDRDVTRHLRIACSTRTRRASRAESRRASDRHDVGFLGLTRGLIDLGDRAVGQLLHLVESADARRLRR